MGPIINKKVHLQLIGLDSNAFAIIGAWSTAARRQGWTPDEIKAVQKAATAGNYDNLLCVISMHTEDPAEEADEPHGNERGCGDDDDKGCPSRADRGY